jgi:phosphoglycerate mutase, BPG-dependent, family 1
MGMTYQLILLRHGNSEWNQKNLFTGWVDVGLTDQGRSEAKRAGELLRESGLNPKLLFTSRLKRAIHTAEIALAEADLSWLDVIRDWRLNERHYGALQGKDKAQTLEQYGPEKFQTWRRSFDVPPPEIEAGSEFDQSNDARYSGIEVPKTECLKDVLERMLPMWEETIQPELASRGSVLIAAHGNSLRALVKHLDGISDDEIAELNIPTGIPLHYELDENFKPLRPAVYLDPEAAEAGAASVANQGKA